MSLFARRASALLHTPSSQSPATTIDLGTWDIRAYCRLVGDRRWRIPDGHYYGGTLLNANHPTTSGRFRGQVVLEGHTQGGVVVHQGAAGTVLPNGAVIPAGGGSLRLNYDPDTGLATGTTSGIVFNGFTFTDGGIQCNAPDISFWYSEHTWTGVSTAWGTAILFGYGADNCRMHGTDIHHIGTGPTFQSDARNVTIAGLRIGVIDNGGNYDFIHPDAIAYLGRNISNITISDADICTRPAGVGNGLGIQCQNLTGTWAGGAGSWQSGDNTGLVFARIWIHGCGAAGLQFNSFHRMDGVPTLISGSLTDVHSWGNGVVALGGPTASSNQYIIGIDNDQYTPTIGTNPFPSRINMPGTNCDEGQTQTGTTPYEAWAATSGHAPTDLVPFFDQLDWHRAA